MISGRFRIVCLSPKADRTLFSCGSDALDGYFRQQVSQDVRRRMAACFVALDPAQKIAGFYTLSSASVMINELPEDIGKKLPRYPTVPAIRMGRLAVDRRFQGRGLGGALLADALCRSLRSEIAAYALIVDAKNESAASFYRYHGFIALPDRAGTFFLPLATASRLTGSRSNRTT